MPSRTRRALIAALLFAVAPLVTWAQNEPIPERFATTHVDTDFPGGDLESIFDITFQRCHAACLGNGDCYAFTFDQRNGACFLKDAAGPSAPFEGAISGVISVTDEAVLERARGARAEMGFLEDFDFDLARELSISMAETYAAEDFDEAAWLQLARTETPVGAVGASGAAVTVADSGAAWLAHARAIRVLAGTEGNQTYDMNRRLASAAINAALRLEGPARADAYALLARGLEGTYRGENALAALRAADAIVPGIAPDELARLRETYGFRVLDHDVDAQTATPRICVSFSESLVAERDYSPYLRTGVTGLAIEAEGQQLCVSGVVFGESYDLVVRAGLPSASGETLQRDVPLTVYVRDRGPVVRFPGRAYVLPANGPRALPIETVNADQLDLTPDERARHGEIRGRMYRGVVEEGHIHSQPFSEGVAAGATAGVTTTAVPAEGGWCAAGPRRGPRSTLPAGSPRRTGRDPPSSRARLWRFRPWSPWPPRGPAAPAPASARSPHSPCRRVCGQRSRHVTPRDRRR